jgi:hypothetical protein
MTPMIEYFHCRICNTYRTMRPDKPGCAVHGAANGNVLSADEMDRLALLSSESRVPRVRKVGLTSVSSLGGTKRTNKRSQNPHYLRHRKRSTDHCKSTGRRAPMAAADATATAKRTPEPFSFGEPARLRRQGLCAQPRGPAGRTDPA